MSGPTFDIDFSKPQQGVDSLERKIINLGKTLDILGKDAGSVSQRLDREFNNVRKSLDNVAKSFSQSSLGGEALERAFLDIQNAAQSFYSKLGSQLVDATAKMNAFTSPTSHIRDMMIDVDKKETFSKAMIKIANTTHRASLETEALKAALKSLASDTAKENAALKVYIKEQERLNALPAQREVALNSLRESIAFLNTEEGKNLEIAKLQEKATQKQVTDVERRKIALNELRTELAYLRSDAGKEMMNLQAQAAHEKKLASEIHNRANRLKDLNKELKFLQSDEGKKTLQAEAQIAATKQLAVEEFKRADATQRLKRELDFLQSSEGKEQNLIQAQIQSQKQLNTETHRREEALKKLQRELTHVRSAEGRREQELRSQITAEQQLRKEQDNRVLTTQRLRRELEFLKTAEGREQVMLRAALSREQARLNQNLRVTNQLTAAMRAGLHGLKSSIGMYTSSTILAASATYGLVSAIRSTITVGAEFSATMSRTQAIMGGAIHSAVRDDVFRNMEASIRSLGRSTMFTSTEVASAVTELGQAGLSAGDAMMALKPTLNLAAIGQLDMARAADHATNIMMIFGKEAKDLTEIVDVMSASVTNSNTNIDQLANALTYAGPAAEAMGYDLQETTAAISALANSGFKASRAGTGLRRLFVSLANPTKKGEAVLNEFGISVENAYGETRGLTEVLTNLGDALNKLPETKKLAAIQDLVGVYATAPIAALLNQTDNLQEMEAILQAAEGTAETMRRQIEDNLKYNLKEAMSAFQDAQLQAFNSVEARLQLFVNKVTDTLTSLTEVRFSQDGFDVTGMDIYIARLEKIIKLGGLLGGLYLFRRVSQQGGIFDSLGDSASSASKAISTLSLRIAAHGEIQKNFLLNTQRQTLATRAGAGALTLYARALTGVHHAARLASIGMARLGAAMTFLSRFAGYIGLLYTGYEIISSIFSDKTNNQIIEQKKAVEGLTKSYLSLREEKEKAAKAEETKLAFRTVETARAEIAALEEERELWRRAERGAGLEGTPRVEREIQILTSKIEAKTKYLQNAADHYVSLVVQEEEDLSVGRLKELQAYRDSNEKEYQKAIKARKRAQSDVTGWGHIGLENYDKIISDYESTVSAISRILTSFSVQTKRTFAELNQAISSSIQENKEAVSQKIYTDNITEIEKYAQALNVYTEAKRNFDAVNAYSEASEFLSAGSPDAQSSSRAMEEWEKKLAPKNLFRFRELPDGLDDQLNNLKITYNNAYAELKPLEYATESFAQGLNRVNKELADSKLSGWDKSLADWRELGKTNAEIRQLSKGLKEGTMDTGQRVLAEHQMVKAMERRNVLYKSLQGATNAYSSSIDNLLNSDNRALMAGRKYELHLEEIARLKHGIAKLNGESISEEDARRAEIKAFEELQQVLWETSETYENYALLKAYYAGEEIKDIKKLEAALKGLGDTYKEVGGASVASKFAQTPSTPWEYTGSAAGAIVNYGMRGKEIGSIESELMLETRKDYASSLKGLDEQQFLVTGNVNKAFEDAIKSKELGASRHAQGAGTTQAEKDQYQRDFEDLVALKEAQNEAMIGIEEGFYAQSLSAHEDFSAAKTTISTEALEAQKRNQQMVLGSLAGDLSSMLMMVADANGEFNSGQQAAFIAAKGLAIAQIIMQTEVAAANAKSALGEGYAQAIRAMGYASVGLVTALSVHEFGQRKAESKSSGSNYAGAYDKGGYIPTGKYGIVGEYGPEIVNGPAHVTGREATARKLGGGGDVSINAPISIEYNSQGGGEDSEQDMAQLGDMVRGVVLTTLQNEMRPNGVLYRG